MLFAAMGAAACSVERPEASVTLNVFTAASLTEAFTRIGQGFEAQHPGVAIVFNFAGSQQLAQQLAQGAPADVFASANPQQMSVAMDSGRIARDAPLNFARNRLVIIYPDENPARLRSLRDLAEPELRGRLVLAAPQVPVGEYSLDVLDKAAAQYGPAFKGNVLNNVGSYEENVKAVLTKVALGDAFAGIVYSSDVTGRDASRVGRIDIPDALNTIALYPIAAVADSPHPNVAAEFVRYVLSAAGQNILAEHGFIRVGE